MIPESRARLWGSVGAGTLVLARVGTISVVNTMLRLEDWIRESPLFGCVKVADIQVADVQVGAMRNA